MATMQKIISNLWFDKQAEEAANFYTSIFKDSRIGRIARFGKEGHDVHGMPAGTVMTIEFWLEGQPFLGLNGGPHFKFTEAVSFIVQCEDQAEVDYYWEKLTAGGDPNAQMCGWLKDKYGLSWQIVPRILAELMLEKDERKASSAMKAMMTMKKMDIAALQRAFDQPE